MPIHVPASLNEKVLAAVTADLSRRFPGADIGIREFWSELDPMARPHDRICLSQVVSFRGVGTESTKAADSPYPMGSGEEFSFKGVWKQAMGLVALTVKKLGSLRF